MFMAWAVSFLLFHKNNKFLLFHKNNQVADMVAFTIKANGSGYIGMDPQNKDKQIMHVILKQVLLYIDAQRSRHIWFCCIFQQNFIGGE